MFRRDFLKSGLISFPFAKHIESLSNIKLDDYNPNIITTEIRGVWPQETFFEFGEQIRHIIEHHKFEQEMKVSEYTRDSITSKIIIPTDHNRCLYNNELTHLVGYREENIKDKVFPLSVSFRINPNETSLEIGRNAIKTIGNIMGEALDSVIISGDGIYSPKGILNTNRIIEVDWNKNTSIQNYIDLKRAVKIEKYSNSAFCGTETSYQRARALPVGINYNSYHFNSYEFMEHNYGINDEMGNETIIFGDFSKYELNYNVKPSIRIISLSKVEMYLGIYTAFVTGGLADTTAFAKTTTAHK